MNTPEIVSSQIPGRSAAFFRRLAANAYDAVLLFAVWILAAAPFAIYFVVLRRAPTSALMQTILHWYWPLVGFAYFAYGWVRGGQTFGMQAWRLRVSTVHGGPLGILRALVRYLLALTWFAALADGFVLLFRHADQDALIAFAVFALAYLWIFFDPQAQALHDRLAGTRVLFVPRSPRPRKQPDAPGDQN